MTYTRTAPQRGSVVHAISPDESMFTLCGRRIGAHWQGEYTEAPSSPINCKGCTRRMPDHSEGCDGQCDGACATDLTVRFRVGSRVGIIAGVATGFRRVFAYGTVVKVLEHWQGSLTYYVQRDGTDEVLGYEVYLLTDASPADDDEYAQRPEEWADANDEPDDVTSWRNLRGHYVASARRYLRDAQTLRGYGDRSAVLLALRHASQYRRAAYGASVSLAAVSAGEQAW